MPWRARLPDTDLDLDRVEVACRAIATAHLLTIQLRARERTISCWFEIRGPDLRAWELRAGADARQLDDLWRRAGYDGVQRIVIEIALAATTDGDRATMCFDLRTGTNLLARRAGVDIANALGIELGATVESRA